MEKTTIALFGAAGNMGTRAWTALKDEADCRLLYVEAGERGLARLRERGLDPTLMEQAAGEAEVAILAVPDHLIGRAAQEIVPHLKSGALVICLDPAAPHAGRLPKREDISYFVTHPAHPPLFDEEETPEARRDFFGGVAKQAIVCALLQGSEEDYARGEAIARKLWKPVLRAHRVTVEQMAILEPALSETVAATCIVQIRKAMDEAIRRGVPAEAARDFLMGHLKVEIAIAFGEIDWYFSEGAQKAIREAEKKIFQPDWTKVFDPEHLRASVEDLSGE